MNKILVANRGEIAVRIFKTAKKMGIKTVAIYSEADEFSPHVKFADEAFCVGPPLSNESYLRGDYIIELALKHGVDGIHPGYGFLSENAEFATKVIDSGITFIGPSAHAINIMGDKLDSKQAVKEYGVPLVPGTDEPIANEAEALEIAKEIGFPMLIKASAGGGGKGMRSVFKPEDLKEGLTRAMSEAQNAFGNPAVFIERLVQQPRHIEFQIMADTHGNVVHLFERECSVQRRHQKVVEEAPSAVLTEELRQRMGEAACNVAKSCNYVGAGTVEFLLTQEMEFYFLEMNTRLQVEHPVTELVTGLDLVEWQIRVARGEKLAFGQNDVSITGHAMEVRLYSEDPHNDFMPSIGKIERFRFTEDEGTRLDLGYEEGMLIPIFYDPMLGKLITYSDTRIGAIDKMDSLISNAEISGFMHNLEYCQFVMQSESFQNGNFTTAFVQENEERFFEWSAERAKSIDPAIMSVTVNEMLEEKHTFTPIHQESNWKNR